MKNLTENKPSYILILMELIRLVNINTTSCDEEDFLLVTDLTDNEIQDIITPIVEAERENPEDEVHFYDNEGLFWALKDHYPNNLVIHYTLDGIDSLTI
jgi:hypothetical protein